MELAKKSKREEQQGIGAKGPRDLGLGNACARIEPATQTWFLASSACSHWTLCFTEWDNTCKYKVATFLNSWQPDPRGGIAQYASSPVIIWPYSTHPGFFSYVTHPLPCRPLIPAALSTGSNLHFTCHDASDPLLPDPAAPAQLPPAPSF